MNDRIITPLFIFCSLLFAFFYTPPVGAQESFPTAAFNDLRGTGQAEIVEVVGPLTLLLSDGQIVRLSGIEVPAGAPASDESGPWAVTARNILRDMFLAKRVTVYQTQQKNVGRTNRMGHALVHLERHSDKAWAQGTLLSLGLARVRSTQFNPEMTEQMYLLEAIAREEKIGIWSDDSYAILTPETAAEAIGDFGIVEGRVESVALNKNRIYINFGKNWRDDFTVTIAPENKRIFSKAGINPMDWGGKLLRVRGYLKNINGPSIEVDHPEAVEVIDIKDEP